MEVSFSQSLRQFLVKISSRGLKIYGKYLTRYITQEGSVPTDDQIKKDQMSPLIKVWCKNDIECDRFIEPYFTSPNKDPEAVLQDIGQDGGEFNVTKTVFLLHNKYKVDVHFHVLQEPPSGGFDIDHITFSYDEKYITPESHYGFSVNNIVRSINRKVVVIRNEYISQIKGKLAELAPINVLFKGWTIVKEDGTILKGPDQFFVSMDMRVE